MKEALFELYHLDFHWLSWPFKDITPPQDYFKLVLIKDGHMWIKSDDWFVFVKNYKFE